MVAPIGGSDEEIIGATIKINSEQATAALKAIVESEDSVIAKTEQLKNFMIEYAQSNEVSVEKAAASFRALDAAFAGTTKSIISNALKLSQIQLAPIAGPTTAENLVGPDLQEEAGIAQAASRIKIESLQEEQKYEEARHAQAVADRQFELDQIAATRDVAMVAKADEAAAAQVANAKIVASIQQIVTAETSVEVKTQQLAQLMIKLAVAGGVPLETIAAQFKSLEGAFAGTSTGLVGMALNSAKASQGFDTLGKSAGGMGNIMGRLEFSFIRFTALFAVIGLVRDFITYLGEATDAALKFSQSLAAVDIGARAAQRLGSTTTIAGYKQQIEDMQKQFPIFSRAQATEAYSNALVLTRGLKLTSDQFQQLMTVSASASVLLGRDFGETATGIAKSLSSGWFEAAQRAGYLINRQAVVDEALKLNIENAKHGYNAMTQYERAIASLSVYVKENGVAANDVSVIMDTQAGKVQRANAAWANMKLAIGEVLSPLKALGASSGFVFWFTKNVEDSAKALQIILTYILAFNRVIGEFIRYLGIVVDALAKAFNFHPIQTVIQSLTLAKNAVVEFFLTILRAEASILKFWESFIPDSVLKRITAVTTALSSFFGQMKSASGSPTAMFNFDFAGAWQKALSDASKFTGLKDLLGNAGYDAGVAAAQGIEDGADSVDVAGAFKKLSDNIYDEMVSLDNKLTNLWVDFTRKIHDIVVDTQRRIAEATQKYQTDVANENTSAATKRADAERVYRNNELDAEARFQEQLRQLREKFLFDLEDALRERDARQVLRLTRQYQMDVENTTKEAELAAQERQRAHEEEMRQLSEQHAERLRLLAQAYEQEIAMIHLQEQQKMEDAALAYARDQADAKKAAADRIEQMALDFARQYNLTQQQAAALVKMLQGYFGTSGPVARIYDNLYQYIMRLVGLANSALNALGNATNYVPGGGAPAGSTAGTNYVPGGHAKGGSFLATRATSAIFGEAGPELATFTPINQISQHQQNVSKALSDININTNQQQGAAGNLELVVTLDPNLKAEIVNESMYNVSTIVREVNRSR